MKEISQILSYILPILYLGVLLVYYLIFSGKKKTLENNTTVFLFLLMIFHSLEIILRHVSLHTIPLSSAHDAWSFLAYSILFVYLIIEMSLNNRGSGIFILSLAFFFELISSFYTNWEPETNELLRNPAFAIHASIAITGYTALSLSAVYALMYLLQNRNIKEHRLGNLYTQLPPLMYLERMSIRSVIIGIILLGIGVLLGHIQAKKLIGVFWPNDLKVIVTDVIWLLYVFGYSISKKLHWNGKKMAWLSVSGFLILIFGGGIIIYLSNSFHRFF